jgi:tripartite-type tricarboxylate transporter receptor subunit TctC
MTTAMASRAASAIFAGLLCAVSAQAQTQDYPNRPIKIIVPFSPGGAVDGPTRAIAQELSRQMKQQVIVENKPGAGSTIGTEAVAKAPHDGYTLLLASQTNAISASLYKKLSYDPVEDFVGIALLGREPAVLAVHPAMPVKSVAELIDYAKARPGQVNYASSGNGSGQHLFTALFASMAGTPGTVAHIKSGKLRALAVSGSMRSPLLPDVPTLAESGLTGYAAYVWMGLLAPKGTPAPVIERLHRELKVALAAPEVVSFFAAAGIESAGSTPAEFDAYLREERERWARVIKDAGVTID